MLDMILLSAVIVAVTGLILGLCIALTAKKFEVPADPQVEAVQELLPGANCGGCGYAGCSDLANAIVHEGVEPTKCVALTEEQNIAISGVLGVQPNGVNEKMVAVVFCGGSVTRARRNAHYNGILDCRSAAQICSGGGKACRYGCLGFASCARACPFGAIEMRDGLAVVHPELCRGCGKCVAECPRKLIRLVPATAKIHVYCNSLDKPQEKRKNCTVTCLTCRKCVRLAPENMNVQDQLVRVNYKNPPEDPAFVEQVKCPTGALQTEESHRRLVPRVETEDKKEK